MFLLVCCLLQPFLTRYSLFAAYISSLTIVTRYLPLISGLLTLSLRASLFFFILNDFHYFIKDFPLAASNSFLVDLFMAVTTN